MKLIQTYGKFLYLFFILFCIHPVFPHNDEPGCGVPVVTTHNSTSSSITVNWQLVSTPNTEFKLFYRRKGTISFSMIYPISNTSSSYTINNLLASSTYEFRLQKVCNKEILSPAVLFEVTTLPNIPPVCLYDPTQFTFIDSTLSTLTLTWSSSNVALSPTGRRFVCSYYDQAGQQRLTIITSGTSHTFKKLKSGKKHDFAIKEVFDGLEGQYTAGCDVKIVSAWTKYYKCNPDATVLLKCEDEKNFYFEVMPAASGLFQYEIFQDYDQNPNFAKVSNSLGFAINTDKIIIAKSTIQPGTFNLSWRSGYNLNSIDPDEVIECKFNVFGTVKDFDFPTNPMTSLFPDVDCDLIADVCDANNNDGPCGDIDGDGIPNKDDTDNTIKGKDLPNLDCKTLANPPIAQPSQNLVVIPNGELLKIFDIPLLVKGVNVVNGWANGNGAISIPFGGKKLKLDFKDVKVNNEKEIYSGTVTVASSNLSNFANIQGGVLKIGNVPFCATGPSDKNDYIPGFSDDGEWPSPPYPNWQAPAPYDPRYNPQGFDKDGKYLGKDEFDPNGCNVHGLNKDGKACVSPATPYHWMVNPPNTANATPTTKEGEAVAKEIAMIANFADDFIKPQLVKLYNISNDSVTAVSARCASYRPVMEGFIAPNNLNFDRVFIFGENDIWLKKGMHKQFVNEPIFDDSNQSRNKTELDLERYHVALYHCDKRETTFSDCRDIALAKQAASELLILKNDLIEIIKRLPKEEALKYTPITGNQTNTDAFKKFIYEQLQFIVSKEQQELSNKIGAVTPIHDESKGEWSAINNANTKFSHLKKPESMYDAIASVNGNMHYTALNGRTEAQFMEDVVQQYEQGWEYVNGIHRAYFSEALIQARNKQNLIVGSGDDEVLPFEIKKEIAGRNYSIIVDRISVSPLGANLDAFLIMEIPESGSRIVFRGKNIAFNKGGLGATGSTMELASDVEFYLNNIFKLNLLGNSNTFIKWDCEGFQGMGVDGEVEFCDKYVVPLDDTTLEPIPNESLKVKFTTTMTHWFGLTLQVNVPTFAVKGHEDFKWKVENAILDLSDKATPAVNFPPNYKSPYISAGQLALWKGVYIQKISCTMPNKFTGDDPKLGQTAVSTITVEGTDLLFDNLGFSGTIKGTGDILSLDKGNIGGWAFSINSLSAAFLYNRVAGGGMSGDVYVPLLKNKDNPSKEIKPEDCLAYECFFQPGSKYSFSVKMKSDYTAPLWKADLNLKSSSKVTIEYVNDKFLARAVLNGAIVLGKDIGGVNMDAKEIGFEKLGISNQKPYFTPGIWGKIGGIEANFAGFEVRLDNMGLSSMPEDRVAFNLGLKVQMGEEGKNPSFGADGSFRIIGRLEEENKRQRWIYENIAVDDLIIDASFPGVDRIKGRISFFDPKVPNLKLPTPNPKFGKGFQGSVLVDFAGVDWKLAAVGIFGKTTHNSPTPYKYFMIDALASFEPGIGGAMKLNAFGGGVFYHMDRANDQVISLPGNITEVDPTTLGIGQSLSGVQYEPRKETWLGLKATVAFSTAKKDAFNGNASFEITIASSGGIENIRFDGHARFMEPAVQNASVKVPDAADKAKNAPKEEKPVTSSNAKFAASLFLAYNFKEKEFKGKLHAFVNIEDKVKGTFNSAIPYLAGGVDMYVSPKTWYIYVGTPQVPVKLTFGDDFNLTAYLDIGKQMPPPATVPQELQNILGNNGYKPTSPSSKVSGAGFAFGAGLKIGPKNGTFAGIGSYHYSAGAGFDVMVQKYGSDVICTNTGNPIGVNGWYFNGQLYAYITGGASVAGVDISDFALGGLLVVKGPKPMYAYGALVLKYKGPICRCDRSVTLSAEVGEQCEFQTSNVEPTNDAEIISSISPRKDEEDVSTMSAAQVNFNMPINKDFDLNFNGQNYKYSISTSPIHIEYGETEATKKIINFNEFWNEDKTLVDLEPKSIMPPNTKMKLKVKAFLYKNGNKIREEERVIEFTTGDEITNLPKDNIAASYPTDGMFNFYPAEDSKKKGYIQLKYDQDNIFKQANVKYAVLVAKSGTKPTIYKANYSPTTKKIEFPLSNLEKGKIYEIKLVAAPKGSDTYKYLTAPSSTANSSNGETGFDPGNVLNNPPFQIETSNDDAPVTNTEPQAQKPSDDVIAAYYFRVSQYNSFKEKMDVLKAAATKTIASDGKITIQFSQGEAFDDTEIGNNGYLSLSGSMLDNQWYMETVRPKFYNVLPLRRQKPDSYGCDDPFSGNPGPGYPCGDAIDTELVPEWMKNYSTPSNAPLSNYVNGSFQLKLDAPIQRKITKKEFSVGSVPSSWLSCKSSIAISSFYRILKDIKEVRFANDAVDGSASGYEDIPFILTKPDENFNINLVGEIPITFYYWNKTNSNSNSIQYKF